MRNWGTLFQNRSRTKTDRRWETPWPLGLQCGVNIVSAARLLGCRLLRLVRAWYLFDTFNFEVLGKMTPKQFFFERTWIHVSRP